jgi:tetratricopeptide (TPR) repeat protein
VSETGSGAEFGQTDVSALLARAAWLTRAGHYRDAEAVYRAAVASEADGVDAQSEYAEFLFRTERFPEAETAFRSLLDAALRTSDTRLRAAATHNLAAVRRATGDARGAAELQQRSVSAELQGTETTVGEVSASTLSSLAIDALLAGRFNVARKLLRRALTLEAADGSLEGQAADWGSLGLVAIFQERYSGAVACLVRAYVRHRKAGDAHGMGCDLSNLAEVARRIGRTHASLRFLRRALAKFESVPAPLQAKKTRLLIEQLSRVAEVQSRDPRLN